MLKSCSRADAALDIAPRAPKLCPYTIYHTVIALETQLRNTIKINCDNKPKTWTAVRFLYSLLGFIDLRDIVYMGPEFKITVAIVKSRFKGFSNVNIFKKVLKIECFHQHNELCLNLS